MSHVARALIALLLVACGSSPIPTESAFVAPLVTPSTVVSPTPTRTPAPRVSPTLPTTPTPRPTLRVDGMAQVAINHLGQVVAPEISDPRDQIRLAIGALDIGETVFLVDMREFGGQAHWELGRASWRPNLPLGWVPELDDNGLPTLFPYEPDCPDEEDLTAQAIIDVGAPVALACFGDRELTLVGDVDCYHVIADAIVAGAGWLSEDRSCTIDDKYGLHGPAVTMLLDGTADANHVAGRYLVRGHFDDPGSAGCGWIPFGTSGLQPQHPGESGPVLICRQLFVVTSVERIT